MPPQVHQSNGLFDKALELKASENYNLSIRLSLDGFSFCVFDINKNKFLALQEFTFQEVNNYVALNQILSQIIPSNEWLMASYHKIKIIFETNKSTLIPSPLFDSNHAREYLKFNHPPQLDEIILTDHLPMLEAENIWAIPESIHSTLNKHFPKSHIHHHASSLIESLILQNKNQANNKIVFVHIGKKSFDIIILDGQSFIFYNSFRYQAKEDFIYYLIYVLEQLNLNPENIDVVLLGEILKISSLYEITYKYIRNIRFGKRSADFQYSYVFDEIPDHFHFNLIHLQNCEL